MGDGTRSDLNLMNLTNGKFLRKEQLWYQKAQTGMKLLKTKQKLLMTKKKINNIDFSHIQGWFLSIVQEGSFQQAR